VCHLLLVLVIMVGFWKTGKLSRIDDAWDAVAQVLGAVADEWVRDMDQVDDEGVKRWLEDHGQHKSLAGVESVGGRVQI
jgi:hypothetical protein